MSRWSYLPSRLVILGLILLALWASADPISQMIVVRSIENRTGGKVEVAQLTIVSLQKILGASLSSTVIELQQSAPVAELLTLTEKVLFICSHLTVSPIS